MVMYYIRIWIITLIFLLYAFLGDDCTDVFAAFHPSTALQDLKKFQIGQLDETIIPTGLYANKLKPEKQKAFEAGYRELRVKMIALGKITSTSNTCCSSLCCAF